MPTPYEQANHRADQYGESVIGEAATAASKLTQQLGGILLDEKKKADLTAVQEALNAQREANDSNLEFLRRAQGKNAAVVSGEVYKDATERTRKAMGGLANDEQKTLFADEANKELLQLKRIGEAHVGQQIQATRDQTLKSGLAIATKRAITVGVDAPDVLQSEVERIERDVSVYGSESGWDGDSIKAFTSETLSKVYGGHVRELLARGRTEEARDILTDPKVEAALGDDAAVLRGRVRDILVDQGGERDAADALARRQNKDKTYNMTAALDDADKKYKPGTPENKAMRASITSRASVAEQGRRLQEGQNWDKAASLYQAQSSLPGNRSVYELKMSNRDAWDALTPDQQHALEQREHTDKNAKDSAPLTKLQEEALARLENDIVDRPDWWGTAPDSALTSNRDYNVLPERFRIQLLGQASRARAEKANPEGAMKSAESTIRARAQKIGYLSSDTVGKPFDKWPDDDKAKWVPLTDAVRPQVVAWRMDEKTKKTPLPGAMVEGFVDEAQRTGTIKGGRWLGLRDAHGIAPADAAARPAKEQAEHPYNIDPTDDEDTIGRKVQGARGKSEKATPAAYAPEALIQAARDWRRAQAGPDPQTKVGIEEGLKKLGRATTPDVIQRVWETTVLGYAPTQGK
jgi:hypothetical protein